MLQICCQQVQEARNTWIFPVVVSVMGLIVAYYSWLSNTKPVLIFYMNSEGRIKIKNVGNGPAMNLVIAYVNSENKWVNPVRCYSMRAGGMLSLDWFVDAKDRSLMYKKADGGGFIIVTDNKEHKELGKKSKEDLARELSIPDKIYTVGHGVAKYGVTYSSAFGLRNTYTSILEDDITKIHNWGGLMPTWKKEEIVRLWQTVKETDTVDKKSKSK